MNVRRSIAAAAVVLAAPALSSCGVNFGAQTDQVYNPSVGVDERSADVDVLNALVVSKENGSGTVIATLVNNNQSEADALSGIKGGGQDSGLEVTTGGSTEIPAGGLLNLAEDGENFVTGERIQAGYFVEITFSFEQAGDVTMNIPVVTADDPAYADVPLPSGS